MYDLNLFYNKSAKHEDCVCFNPFHIKRTSSLNRKTSIMYSNGKNKIIPAKLSSFNDKLKQAEQLEEMTGDTCFMILNNPNDTIFSSKHQYTFIENFEMALCI
ncbi:hypothetical protein F7731_09345 [Cytobacillus depressus]|uniref:Uncharacterized protein n=1 Tax=Cytobacillus depressus TaxID=1602942 RepID=A0A6L3V910_9BACI|nr:hypothetical protein F7731_09345 [Cytobacillus depressus]